MDDYFETYNTKASPFDCGLTHVGGLPRKEVSQEIEDKFKENIKQLIKTETKISLSLLKCQENYRKVCEELGFDKSPEYLSKYNRNDTIAFYTYGKKK